MLPVTYLFSDAVKALIAEYNINSRMNTFLYNNADIHQWFKDKGQIPDRFDFVVRCNRIEEELLVLLRDQFNGREVVTADTFTGKDVKGKIEINLMRTYDGHTFRDNMAMRGVNDGNALDQQTVAFWVVTDNPMTTHLYTADKVMLAFPDSNEQDILMERYQLAADAAAQERFEEAHP